MFPKYSSIALKFYLTVFCVLLRVELGLFLTTWETQLELIQFHE